MPNIARKDDVIKHGAIVTGSVTQGSPDVFANDRPVARIGDMAFCSLDDHGPVRIITGSQTVFVNGRGAARTGSLCECGAVVWSDSNVYVDEGSDDEGSDDPVFGGESP